MLPATTCASSESPFAAASARVVRLLAAAIDQSVSPANARGVMQLLPGTWNWVQDQLAGRRLDPSSALENVHAGSMYLRQLLADANGDQALALASYYQGSASVRSIGMLPETQRYVADVMALRARFGGP